MYTDEDGVRHVYRSCLDAMTHWADAVVARTAGIPTTELPLMVEFDCGVLDPLPTASDEGVDLGRFDHALVEWSWLHAVAARPSDPPLDDTTPDEAPEGEPIPGDQRRRRTVRNASALLQLYMEARRLLAVAQGQRRRAGPGVGGFKDGAEFMAWARMLRPGDQFARSPWARQWDEWPFSALRERDAGALLGPRPAWAPRPAIIYTVTHVLGMQVLDVFRGEETVRLQLGGGVAGGGVAVGLEVVAQATHVQLQLEYSPGSDLLQARIVPVAMPARLRQLICAMQMRPHHSRGGSAPERTVILRQHGDADYVFVGNVHSGSGVFVPAGDQTLPAGDGMRAAQPPPRSTKDAPSPGAQMMRDMVRPAPAALGDSVRGYVLYASF